MSRITDTRETFFSRGASNRPNGGIGSAGGFSLVEVLVAAAILIVLIFAVIAAVRKGRELQVNNDHRRAARALIHAKLETDFDFRDFNTIPENTNTSYTDTLELREGNPVTCTIRTGIVPDTIIGPGTTPIPVKMVTITAKWNEAGMSASDEPIADSIEISKWVAKAKE